MNTIFHIMRSPPGGILEQSNTTNRLFRTKIEPVLNTRWYVDQISRLNLNGEDGSVFGIDVKDAGSLNGEPNFVFTMGMLFTKLLEHPVNAGCFRIDTDHICRHELTGFLESLDSVTVGLQDFFIVNIDTDAAFDIPLFVLDSKGLEKLTDLVHIFNSTIFVLQSNTYQIIAFHQMVSFNPGICLQEILQHQLASHAFEEKFKDLNVSSRGEQILSPGIKSMLAQQKPMWVRLFARE